MVASTRRSRRSALDSRSNELSQSDRRLPQPQPCAVSNTTFVDVGKATATTAATSNQAAGGPSFSEKSPLLAADPPLPEPSSAPILLGCQICHKGKDFIKKPVVTFCGHLFCWRCLLDRIPPEAPLRYQVRLPCPVCEYPQVGGSRNNSLNTIIPVYRKHEPPSDRLESDEQPLPEPNAFPVSFFDEKVMMFHEVARVLKYAEDGFLSITEHTKKRLDSVDEQFQQIMKRVGLQSSTSAETTSK